MTRDERIALAEAKAEVGRAYRFWEQCEEEARRAERAWLDAVEALEAATERAGGAA